jgi:hypothetical protein
MTICRYLELCTKPPIMWVSYSNETTEPFSDLTAETIARKENDSPFCSLPDTLKREIEVTIRAQVKKLIQQFWLEHDANDDN